MTTSTKSSKVACRAYDPNTCRFHGNQSVRATASALKAEMRKATVERDYSAFENAKQQLEDLNRRAAALEVFEERAEAFQNNARWADSQNEHGYLYGSMVGSAITDAIRMNEGDGWEVDSDFSIEDDGTISISLEYEETGDGWWEGVDFESYFPDAFEDRTELSEEEAVKIAVSINREVYENFWEYDSPANDEQGAAICRDIVTNLADSLFGESHTKAEYEQTEAIVDFNQKASDNFCPFSGSDVMECWERYQEELAAEADDEDEDE